MSRRPSQTFVCRELAELTRQLLFAPPDKRLEQVRRAEQLHDEVEAGRNYPFEFLQFRITGYRGETPEPTVLVGEAVLPDLRLMIDSLSRSVGMGAGADEEFESPVELAARLHVTTRTVARWRRLGLRWRWVSPSGTTPAPGTTPGVASAHESTAPRLMIGRDAVERFLRDHAGRVERAGRYTRIASNDRERLVRRARRIVLARPVSLNRVAVHLARRTGRAVETIRQLLEQHDRAHPRKAIFADRSGPLDSRRKRVIARAHRMGVPVSRIAARFNKTHSTIYRAVRERRAAELRKLDIHFVASPLFKREDADTIILPPPPELPPELPPDLPPELPAELKAASGGALEDSPGQREGVAEPAVPADDLPVPLGRLYRQPGLAVAVERGMFVRFNYLKFKAAQVRDGLDRYEPRVGDMDKIDQLLDQAARLRNGLAAANLRRVLSVTRRHETDHTDAAAAHLVSLLSLGNRVLIEAIEQFDPGRGQSFESFLTFSLQRRFVQAPATTRAHRRPDGQAIMQAMIDDAAALGVRLI